MISNPFFPYLLARIDEGIGAARDGTATRGAGRRS